jgi:hypothetical protein
VARSLLENLPESTITEDTIRRMYGLVDSGKTDDKFQRIVYSIVNRSMRGQWKDYEREINTVFQWFKDHCDYRRDPYGVELIQDVWATMDRKRFDCDDACIWLGAACEILGAPVRFVTVSTRPDNQPSHVYAECFAGGRWIPLDATVPWASVGWEPTEVKNKQVWSRKKVGLAGYYDDEPGMEGLGMIAPRNGTHWEGGFANRMFQVKPGVPVSTKAGDTWAFPPPGRAFVSERLRPSNFIAMSSQKPSMPAAGGRPYFVSPPIRSHMTPAELRHTISRKRVPVNLNLNQVWPPVPTWGPDPSYMYPQAAVPKKETIMTGLAGLDGAAEAEAVTQSLTDSVVRQVQTGEIPNTAEAIKAASNLAVSYYQARQAQTGGTAPAPLTQPYTPVRRSGLPSWVIPAAIVGVVLVAGGFVFLSSRKK